VILLSMYRMIALKGKNPAFFYILAIYFASFAVMLIHYQLSKKYKYAALTFSMIQTI
jgi:hypothetical protein